MSKARKIKIGLLVAALAVPSAAIADGYTPGPQKSILRGITAPIRHLNEKIQRAFQHPIIIIDSAEYKAAEEQGIDINELKEFRANKFCEAQGFEFALQSDFREVAGPVTAYRFSPGTGSTLKMTVQPTLKDQYVFHSRPHGVVVDKIITKEEYETRAKQTRNGEVNQYLEIVKVPAPSILMTTTCSIEPRPDQEWGNGDPLYQAHGHSSDEFAQPFNTGFYPYPIQNQYEENPLQSVRRAQYAERIQMPVTPANFRVSHFAPVAPHHETGKSPSLNGSSPSLEAQMMKDKKLSTVLRIYALLKAQGDNHSQILEQLRKISARLDSNKAVASPSEDTCADAACKLPGAAVRAASAH